MHGNCAWSAQGCRRDFHARISVSLICIIMVWQYILYFFIYSALGWAAEVTFAAFKQHKLVNRGFLNGPLCPV